MIIFLDFFKSKIYKKFYICLLTFLISCSTGDSTEFSSNITAQLQLESTTTSTSSTSTTIFSTSTTTSSTTTSTTTTLPFTISNMKDAQIQLANLGLILLEN